MSIFFQKFITRQDLKNNPLFLFVFGDNEQRVGFGGQAKEMRGEPNAFGIPTLTAPGVFWSDKDYEHNCSVIEDHIQLLKDGIMIGEIVVFPVDGIGTGLADLPNSAPRTFNYLQTQLSELFKLAGIKDDNPVVRSLLALRPNSL